MAILYSFYTIKMPQNSLVGKTLKFIFASVHDAHKDNFKRYQSINGFK